MVKYTRHLWHPTQISVSSETSERLEADAAKHWNTFYQQNQTNFFKDRHYLHREFPELIRPDCVMLEVGCGVGNTAYPLLELNRSSQVFACDFAPEAVELVKANPEYKSDRIHAFVADITSDRLSGEVKAPVDFCTMIFVLSAIAPAKMPAAIANVAAVLQPGTGCVLVRDYAEGDLAQLRLAGPSRSQRLSENFYVRSDGTRAYYFTKASLLGLFCEAGFACTDFQIHERQIENRRQQVVMHRRWVQAKFVYSHGKLPVSSPGSAMNQQADVQQTHTQQAEAQQANTQQASAQQANTQPADLHTQQASALGLVLQSPRQELPGAVGHKTRHADLHSASCQHSCGMMDLHDIAFQEATHHRQQPHNDAALPDVPKHRQFSQGSSSVTSPSDVQTKHDHQLHQATEQKKQQQVSSAGQYSCSCTVKAEAVNAQNQQQTRHGQHQEWEQGGSTPDVEQFTGGMFNDEQLEQVTEKIELEENGLVAEVVSVSRQYRNTLEHTGLMCWESSLPLARFLLAAPSLIQGAQVLEVGSGVNPVCCLAALRHCRRYVATDGSPETLQGLARNLDLNARRVIMERARVCQLIWGSDAQQKAIQQTVGLFDVIIGADVVYSSEAIDSLLSTINTLLKTGVKSRVLLCYIVRRVSEDFLHDCAAQHGLEVLSMSPVLADAAKRITKSDPFRFMLLKRTA